MEHADAAAERAMTSLAESSCEAKKAQAKPEARACQVCGRPVGPVWIGVTRRWLETDLCGQCLKASEDAAADAAARQERAYRQRLRLAESGLPPRAEGWSFETAEKRIGQVLDGTDLSAWLGAHLRCRTWVNTGRRPLYILGATGTGKTILAYCIVRQAIVFDDLSAYLMSISDFFDQIDMGVGREAESSRMMNRAKTAQVLVMDDLGARRASKAKADRLFSIVDHRYRQHLPMVITTNLQPSALNAELGDGCGRIVSRLLHRAEAVKIELEAGDMRLLGLAR